MKLPMYCTEPPLIETAGAKIPGPPFCGFWLFLCLEEVVTRHRARASRRSAARCPDTERLCRNAVGVLIGGHPVQILDASLAVCGHGGRLPEVVVDDWKNQVLEIRILVEALELEVMRSADLVVCHWRDRLRRIRKRERPRLRVSIRSGHVVLRRTCLEPRIIDLDISPPDEVEPRCVGLIHGSAVAERVRGGRPLLIRHAVDGNGDAGRGGSHVGSVRPLLPATVTVYSWNRSRGLPAIAAAVGRTMSPWRYAVLVAQRIDES